MRSYFELCWPEMSDIIIRATFGEGPENFFSFPFYFFSFCSHERVRIDQTWHWTDLLVLNILAESSPSCSEALGGRGLMLTFQTCGKDADAHGDTHTHKERKEGMRRDGEIYFQVIFCFALHSGWQRSHTKKQKPNKSPIAVLKHSDSNWPSMAEVAEVAMSRAKPSQCDTDVKYHSQLIICISFPWRTWFFSWKKKKNSNKKSNKTLKRLQHTSGFGATDCQLLHTTGCHNLPQCIMAGS